MVEDVELCLSVTVTLIHLPGGFGFWRLYRVFRNYEVVGLDDFLGFRGIDGDHWFGFALRADIVFARSITNRIESRNTQQRDRDNE
jgi:hypothetical protein